MGFNPSGESENCPWCGTMMSPSVEVTEHLRKGTGTARWYVLLKICGVSACRRLYIKLRVGEREGELGNIELIYPRAHGRKRAPVEVGQRYSDEYEEACNTLTVSPKAAAALARRLLQDLLRGPGGVAHSNLATEIAAARTTLPASIATCLDVLRHVGNFAAHPIKDTATGTIIDVEVGEAEFTLDVILQLFEHYFVTPAIAAKAKDAINQMLVKAGKQPIP